MENKNNIIDIISEIVEEHKTQKDKIDKLESSKKKLQDILNEETVKQFSTETHVLVEREVLQDLKMDFDELADGFQQLENNLEDIGNYANDIVSDSEYNDAGTLRDTARDCISKIEDILDPMPEEETEETE